MIRHVIVIIVFCCERKVVTWRIISLRPLEVEHITRIAKRQPGHTQPIVGIDLISHDDLDVLAGKPVARCLLLDFDADAVGGAASQLVHVLQSEPEVVVHGTETGLVCAPGQAPVESVAEILMNNDPAKNGLGGHLCCRCWYRDGDVGNFGNVGCSIVNKTSAGSAIDRS